MLGTLYIYIKSVETGGGMFEDLREILQGYTKRLFILRGYL